LPRPLEDLVRQFDWLFKDSHYRTVRATADSDAYKQLLGGGAEHWNERGRFQLHLLRELGLKPEHSLLDVGCGPGRASRYLIEYLAANRYAGVDYNPDFIEIARRVVSEGGLSDKHAHFQTVQDFELGALTRRFDFMLLFSVLNHCNERQKRAFFRAAGGALTPQGKLVISHARWLSPRYLSGSGLELVDGGTPRLKELQPESYGFVANEIEPVLVLQRRG
jgi:SAM-dependent methyltransferase